MANVLGVGATTYGNWENGIRLPDAAAMVRLLEKTGIGPDWVYAGSRRGVPFDLAEKLERYAAEIGAAVRGAVADSPTAFIGQRTQPPNPMPRVARVPRGQTLHERPEVWPKPPRD